MKHSFDLEERTYQFAERVRFAIKEYPKTQANFEDSKQLIRASGSVAANYIEANDALSKKDFKFRVKICRKESKECRLFLRLILNTNELSNEKETKTLIEESVELKKIFSAIIKNS